MDDEQKARAARVKHDLGKYVAFQIRWLGPDADLAARRDALAADVLGTRKGPEGSTTAPELWRELRIGLEGLEGNPDLDAIDASIAVIEALLPSLRGGSTSEADVDRGIEAALAVADAAKRLARG